MFKLAAVRKNVPLYRAAGRYRCTWRRGYCALPLLPFPL